MTDDVELTLGVRHDHYDDVGSTTNPRVGLVWSFNTNGDLKLLYGSAFRAPNFEELYNANNPAVIGNSSLRPEEVETYEASISYRFPHNIRTTVTYFHNEIEDQIVLNPATARFENLGGTDTDGMEAEIKIKLKRHSAYANYSYQHSVDNQTNKRIPFTAMHRGNVGFNVAINPYTNLNANLGIVGERRRELGDNRNELPSYVLVDAALVASDLVKNATFTLSAHNLLDKKYQDPSAAADNLPGDLPRDGRQVMVQASYYFE
jgi:iron complex outermembrane receptor protein